MGWNIWQKRSSFTGTLLQEIACKLIFIGRKSLLNLLLLRPLRIDLHFVIKIADFGLSEDVYLKNYFRQNDDNQSIKLPIKWMAPESLNDGVFSEKTDVVSKGVVSKHESSHFL